MIRRTGGILALSRLSILPFIFSWQQLIRIVVVVPVSSVLPFILLSHASAEDGSQGAAVLSGILFSSIYFTGVELFVAGEVWLQTERLFKVLTSRVGLAAWCTSMSCGLAGLSLVTAILQYVAFWAAGAVSLHVSTVLGGLVLGFAASLSIGPLVLSVPIFKSGLFNSYNLAWDGLQYVSCLYYSVVFLPGPLRPVADLIPLRWIAQGLRDENVVGVLWEVLGTGALIFGVGLLVLDRASCSRKVRGAYSG